MYAVPQTEQKINTQNACLKTPQKYKMKVIQSAYKEPTYKELLVIRNWFSFTNIYHETSSLYVYKELRL